MPHRLVRRWTSHAKPAVLCASCGGHVRQHDVACPPAAPLRQRRTTKNTRSAGRTRRFNSSPATLRSIAENQADQSGCSVQPTIAEPATTGQTLGQCTRCGTHYCYNCAVRHLFAVCACRNLLLFRCNACRSTQLVPVQAVRDELIQLVIQSNEHYLVVDGCSSCSRVTLVCPYNIDCASHQLDIFARDLSLYSKFASC